MGKGSVFTFTLPQEVAVTTSSMDRSELTFREKPIAINSMIKAFSKNAPPSYRNNMKRETPRSLRPKILAVDDDPVNLQVLTNILSEDHYEVEIVTSGKEALHQLERKGWDLIISDVMMPTMSGYELTRSIRERFSISELPILLLTARSNPEDIYTGFLAGANAYVTKPVDQLELNGRGYALSSLPADRKSTPPNRSYVAIQ